MEGKYIQIYLHHSPKIQIQLSATKWLTFKQISFICLVYASIRYQYRRHYNNEKAFCCQRLKQRIIVLCLYKNTNTHRNFNIYLLGKRLGEQHNNQRKQPQTEKKNSSNISRLDRFIQYFFFVIFVEHNREIKGTIRMRVAAAMQLSIIGNITQVLHTNNKGAVIFDDDCIFAIMKAHYYYMQV